MTDDNSSDERTTVTVHSPPTVSKVRIDTPGVSVDIEAHEPLDTVAATAMRLFREAGGWPQDTSRSPGFSMLERRDTPPTQASAMPHAPGPYPTQMP